MTSRFTPLAASWLGLLALALFLGVLSGRPELFVVAAPLLVVLLVGTRAVRPPRYTVTHGVSAVRLFEEERLSVTVTVTAHDPMPLLELAEVLPATVEPVSGHTRAVFTLRAGVHAQWTYELRCPARGHLSLGHLELRSWEPAGFRVLETGQVDPKAVRVYPRITRLPSVPRPLRTQTSVGNYVSPRFGSGLEPGEIRPFAPGDQVRHVNWRASLRLGRLYVTQHHLERNADVVLMLDTLSQVGMPPATSLDGCTRAAASLAWAYLARKDRVGLIDYGGTFQWVKPAAGPVQLERLLAALLAARSTFTYVRKDVRLVPPRVLPPQALVIALSPLVDPRFVDAVTDLAARRFDVVLLAVSPTALTRAALGASALTDLACRLWAVERRVQLDELGRRGLIVLDWVPDQPLALALAALRERRSRAALAG